MKNRMKLYLSLSLVMLLALGLLAGCGNASQPQQTAESKPAAQEESAPVEDDEFYEEDDDYYEDEPYEDDFEEEDAAEPEKDESKENDSKGADVTGKWFTEDYDEDANWAASYVIELTADGKATCTGWRNKDAGTYKVDGDTVLITFDDCQTDEPGEGFQPVKDFTYTIEMKTDGDNATIKIDAPDVISNLEDGKVHRDDAAKSSGSGSDDAKSADIADGSYITDDKYSGELSKDGSELTIETGLFHYDKDWNLIKDYDKQKIVLKTSKDCKCVIMQEDVETSPINKKVDFINDFLSSGTDLPIGLEIKGGELVEINFSS